MLEKAGIVLVRRKGRERWNEFAEDGDGTVLRHEFSASGPISDEMAQGIQWHGSLDTFADQLHAWIDRGEVIPPPETT